MKRDETNALKSLTARAWYPLGSVRAEPGSLHPDDLRHLVALAGLARRLGLDPFAMLRTPVAVEVARRALARAGVAGTRRGRDGSRDLWIIHAYGTARLLRAASRAAVKLHKTLPPEERLERIFKAMDRERRRGPAWVAWPYPDPRVASAMTEIREPEPRGEEWQVAMALWYREGSPTRAAIDALLGANPRLHVRHDERALRLAYDVESKRRPSLCPVPMSDWRALEKAARAAGKTWRARETHLHAVLEELEIRPE